MVEELDIKGLKSDIDRFMADHNAELKKIAAEMQGLPEKYNAVKANVDEHVTTLGEIKDVIADLQKKIAFGPGGAVADIFAMPEVKAMGEFAKKGMSIGVPAGGGYVVAPELVAHIVAKEKDFDPIRARCSQMSVGTNVAQVPFEDGAPTVQWVGETTERPKTASPTLGRADIALHHANAYVDATRDILADGVVNVEQYLVNKCIEYLARDEGAKFLVGTGAVMPTGIFNTSGIEEVTGAVTADNLIDLWGEVPSETDTNAIYVVNKKTAVKMRKFKDTAGQYLWQSPLAAGMPSTFNGFETVIAGSAPANSAVFGNFQKYQIVDRMDMTLLRDELTKKDKNMIEFMFQKRVGGAVIQKSSFAILKPATSP